MSKQAATILILPSATCARRTSDILGPGSVPDRAAPPAELRKALEVV
jgi:hypothetical protein